MQTDNIIWIASMTKPMTAAAFMMLVYLVQHASYAGTHSSDIRGAFQNAALQSFGK